MVAAYDPAGYGKAVRGNYDELYPSPVLETASAVDFLSGLVGESDLPALVEFGIGTGRLALGVQDRGVLVAGIDGSATMIEQLRAKPGGDRVRIVLGDYRDARVPGEYGVVCLVFNGIFDPRGLEVQLDIFRNAARHLVPGGFFVVESWVMSDEQRRGGWSVVPRHVSEGHVELQLARYDIEHHTIERTLVHLRGGATDFVSVRDTYAAPAELDVMAVTTGFEKVARYSDWDRGRFTAVSDRHVSIYRRRDDRL